MITESQIKSSVGSSVHNKVGKNQEKLDNNNTTITSHNDSHDNINYEPPSIVTYVKIK
jgi:hypothetical protein